MNDRFRVETNKDGLFFAVALTRFTNKALQKVIEKGEKSGLYDDPETLVQYGTAWIFGDSLARNSKLRDDCAVLNSSIQNTVCENLVKVEDSNVCDSVLEYGLFFHSKITGAEIKNDTKGKALHNACRIIESTVLLKRASICETFYINGSHIAADYCSLCDVNIVSSKIVGNDIDIVNAYIKGVFVGANVSISNSNIALEKEKTLFPISCGDNSHGFIRIDKANVLSSKFLRIFEMEDDILCAYRTEDDKINSLFAVFDKEDNKAVPFYDFVIKNEEMFLDSMFFRWLKNKEKVASFIEEETSALRSVFRGLSLNIPVVKEVILFDLLSVLFAREDSALFGTKQKIEKGMRINIFEGTVLLPKYFFIYSDALKVPIMNETFFSQERMFNEFSKIMRIDGLSAYVWV